MLLYVVKAIQEKGRTMHNQCLRMTCAITVLVLLAVPLTASAVPFTGTGVNGSFVSTTGVPVDAVFAGRAIATVRGEAKRSNSTPQCDRHEPRLRYARGPSPDGYHFTQTVSISNSRIWAISLRRSRGTEHREHDAYIEGSDEFDVEGSASSTRC